jgi:hypothetical protein
VNKILGFSKSFFVINVVYDRLCISHLCLAICSHIQFLTL